MLLIRIYLHHIRNKLNAINIDSVNGIGIVEQLIEKFTYTIFPQRLTTERPDWVVPNAMEIAIEFLREGGLRLPGKIGQTLSVECNFKYFCGINC